MLTTTNPVAMTLIAAKALISDPEHWCQFGFAVDKNGDYCKALDEHAVRWCALGAVDREWRYLLIGDKWATAETRERAMRLLGWAALELNSKKLREKVRLSGGFVSSTDPDLVTCIWPSAINDRLGHREVMEMYRLAIDKALTEEYVEATLTNVA